MINQTHPKILGRLLMGIDAAKRILRRGEPFVLEVCTCKPSSKIKKTKNYGQSSILITNNILLNSSFSETFFFFHQSKCEKIFGGMKTKIIIRIYAVLCIRIHKSGRGFLQASVKKPIRTGHENDKISEMALDQ